MERVGVIGCGEMGAEVIQNLAELSYEVHGYDLDPGQMAGLPMFSITLEEALACPFVITLLPSSEAWLQFGAEEFSRHANPGTLLIEMGTTVPYRFREVASHLIQDGFSVVDAPCSGGPGGVHHRTLRTFLAGDKAAKARAVPILQDIGGKESITDCGDLGQGQVMKGVNQLMMGLINAAYLEALAFGVREGLDLDLIVQAVASDEGMRGELAKVIQFAQESGAEHLGVKFRELPYYLDQARQSGDALPLTEAIYRLLKGADRVTMDDHRPAPSFWHELTRSAAENG